MNIFVVYDSFFGNTKLISKTIAKELGSDTKLIKVTDFKIEELNEGDLLVLGSPIRGWKSSENTQALLNNLNKDQLKGINATTFDTRVRLFIHGDAANSMAKKLEELGAQIIIPPTSFDVKGQEGPLFEGEIEKAIEWAKSIKLQLEV